MSDYQYYEYKKEPEQEQGQDNFNPYQKEPKAPKKKNPNSFGRKMGKAAAMALVFGLVGGTAFQGASYATAKLTGSKTVSETVKQDSSESVETATNLSGNKNDNLAKTAVSTAVTVTDVSDIVKNSMPSIVQVTTVSVSEYRSIFGMTGTYESEGAGSGIIVDQDDDYVYIVTNNHVVSGATSLSVTFTDDSVVNAEVVGTDSTKDLALVKVKISEIEDSTMEQIKVATLGDSESLEIGEGAVVIGNALGYGQSVTTGTISALDRQVKTQNEDGSVMDNALIQTDAAVNPGNSGGALLNMNGEVVGVVNAKLASTQVEGMGYAIPISDAKEFLEEARAAMNGESTESTGIEHTAYLGISGVDVTSEYAIQYSMPTGVYIAGVYSDSGAAAAGLKRGDVIIALNDKVITSMESIQSALAEYQPGDTVKITYATGDSDYSMQTTVDVTLTSNEVIGRE